MAHIKVDGAEHIRVTHVRRSVLVVLRSPLRWFARFAIHSFCLTARPMNKIRGFFSRKKAGVLTESEFPELNEAEEREVLDALGVHAENAHAKDVIFGTLTRLKALKLDAGAPLERSALHLPIPSSTPLQAVLIAPAVSHYSQKASRRTRRTTRRTDFATWALCALRATTVLPTPATPCLQCLLTLLSRCRGRRNGAYQGGPWLRHGQVLRHRSRQRSPLPSIYSFLSII